MDFDSNTINTQISPFKIRDMKRRKRTKVRTGKEITTINITTNK